MEWRISLRLAALGRTKHCHHCREHRRTLGTALTPDLEALKRPPCSLLERIRFRRTAVSRHVHEKKSYNCSSKNCSNILHVQTQNCWQKFSHVLRDCHVKLSSQEIKAYHTGVRRDFISLKLEVKIFATQCKHRQTADTCALTLFIRKPWCTGVSGIAHAMHTRVHCNLCCTHRRCMAHASTLHPPSNAHWQKALVQRMDTLAIRI